MDESTRHQAERLLTALVSAGRTLAVAESLTGGAVCDALVAVPGASRVLRGGIVAYQNDVKADQLGVDRSLLEARGAVDAQVAAQMAQGVRRALGADVGLATTGVAGPEPADGKPAGTVFVGISTSDGTQVRALALAGDRSQVRAGAVAGVLDLALGLLEPGGIDASAS